jgi:outer membrane murein-binding lipoprotein Lpp
MKTSYSAIFAVTIATLVVAGCSPQSSDGTAKPDSSTSANAPVQPAEVQPPAAKVAAEAAPAVKKPAPETLGNLGQQLIESTKGGSADPLVKSISTDLQGRVSKLAASLADNATVKEQLTTAVQALLGNNDVAAISGLNKLTTAKLTPEQTTLVKDVYNAGAALVTQRNFSSIEGMNTDVAQLANSVWKGNYTEALPPLQKLYSQSTLTAPQKELLGATYDKYMPAGWKDAAGTVQKGLDTLKQFGK